MDLVSKEVIDLLPDREADTLAQWLKGHPEITVVSRDRSSTYAMGIRKGAPQARQVADRFHLLMNLGEATKKVFQAKGKDIREAYNLFNNPENPEPEIEEAKQDAELFSEENQVIPDNINCERLYKFEKVKEQEPLFNWYIQMGVNMAKIYTAPCLTLILSFRAKISEKNIVLSL